MMQRKNGNSMNTKKMLSNATLLVQPSKDLNFNLIVAVDASSTSIEGVIHRIEDKEIKPFAFSS